MRILVDASLPASVEERSTPTISFEVASELTRLTSDEELVTWASARAFDAVAFLGRETLARTDLLETARKVGVGVVVTNSDEPIEAEDQLAEHTDDLAEQVGPGRVVLVLTRETRAWKIRARSQRSELVLEDLLPGSPRVANQPLQRG